MRLFLLGLLSLSASMSAHGATIEETLALCHAKGATLERLACYDELARAVAEGVTLSALPNTGIGKWEVHHSVDPIDDTRTVMAFLRSEDYVYGYSGAHLEISCSGGGLAVRIWLQGVRVKSKSKIVQGWAADSSERIGGRGPVKDVNEYLRRRDKLTLVSWRFDKLEAVREEWYVRLNPNKERKIIVPWSSGQEEWAKDALRHSQLAVRIYAVEGGLGDFVFDLRGASRAVEPVRRACGW